ncbi:MAG TPA: glycosyltransferase family 1 protein [Leeuwenhoekiella sp.]|nr:glycosyltransferase family 1 protein [Leeuwenhoekiella sp.]
MKILILSHKFYPNIGGIEVNSEVLSQVFVDFGHEVHLMTWTKEEGDKKFPYKLIRNPPIYIQFREHVWCDIVFENNPCLRLSWPVLFTFKPTVIALNTWVSKIDGSIGIQEKLKNKWLNRAQAVIAVSKAVGKHSWPKSIIIGNPYRNTVFKVLPEILKNKTFVFLGRLVSDKGGDLAILAFKEFVSKFKSKNFSLTIIGDGPELLKLKEIVRQVEIEELVTFTGALVGDKLVECLNSHKYLLVPSQWEEPFGNVVLEGMACGCVPIVSDGGGLPDAIGKAGLIFERGNLKSLIDKITFLLENPQVEKKLRQKAKLHLENHTPQLIGTKYLEVLEKALHPYK